MTKDTPQKPSQVSEAKRFIDRRKFLGAAAAMGAISELASCGGQDASAQDSGQNPDDPDTGKQATERQTVDSGGTQSTGTKSIIGGYGSWASKLASTPASLSFRKEQWNDAGEWQAIARAKAMECLAVPDLGEAPPVSIDRKFQFDGLDVDEMHWHMPNGRPTQAILLKPHNAKGPLPAILGLHDHSGNKYFGKRKITQTSDSMHPAMVHHQQRAYGNLAWANEIAKRGYVVMVHDAFAFASRRVLFEDLSEIPWGDSSTRNKSDENPEDPANIATYNQWATAHEHIMAKSLFCAGTTWPGVCLAEDQRALGVLADREDVDAERMGCAGLSGGGLRTVYLGGLDARIKCAVCVGFMSTWDDFLMNQSFTHTWMTYAPLLPKYLDFPEVLGLRVPLPTMVLSNNEDHLYSLPEMKKADAILQQVFTKAGASDRYHGGFYPGDHQFSQRMQQDAFAWFDKWLSGTDF